VLHEDSVQNWMLTTLSVSNLLSESMSLNDRILLESVPSGGGMLETVIKAMKESRKLSFSYQKYGKQQPDADREVSPYCVKLFRQRWYVLGPIANGEMRLFSLDRMGDVTLQKEKFKMDKNFDAIAYFSESYGVMVDHRVNTERIVLRAYGLEPYYLRDLPLHHSQREIRSTDEYCDFELRLKPTSDFKGKLLQRAEWIEVLEPQSLIDDIIALHQRSINRYKNYTNSGSKT
jgi:predicted DNA-binding transcriptional regulator YafY